MKNMFPTEMQCGHNRTYYQLILGVVATTNLFPVALFFTTCNGRDHATFWARTHSILAQFFRCTKGHFSYYSRVQNFRDGGSPLGFSLLKFCSIF